jgi:serine/threonine protein kinase
VNGKVSAAADVWALGITLIEALTQRPPAWPDRRPEALPLPAGIPVALADIVRRCLRENPADRPTTQELKAPIDSPAPGTSSAPPPAPPPGGDPGMAPPEVSKRRPVVAAIALFAVILVVVWGISRLLHPHHAARLAPVPEPADRPSAEAAAPLPPASSGLPAAVLHPVIPEMSHGAKTTIRGRIKVSVLLTVDQSGRVIKTALKNGASSRYFDRLATQAAGQWQFTQAMSPVPRQWLLHFEFTRDGATGYADGPLP